MFVISCEEPLFANIVFHVFLCVVIESPLEVLFGNVKVFTTHKIYFPV